jgi:hypothetical protein
MEVTGGDDTGTEGAGGDQSNSSCSCSPAGQSRLLRPPVAAEFKRECLTSNASSSPSGDKTRQTNTSLTSLRAAGRTSKRPLSRKPAEQSRGAASETSALEAARQPLVPAELALEAAAEKLSQAETSIRD